MIEQNKRVSQVAAEKTCLEWNKLGMVELSVPWMNWQVV